MLILLWAKGPLLELRGIVVAFFFPFLWLPLLFALQYSTFVFVFLWKPPVAFCRFFILHANTAKRLLLLFVFFSVSYVLYGVVCGYWVSGRYWRETTKRESHVAIPHYSSLDWMLLCAFVVVACFDCLLWMISRWLAFDTKHLPPLWKERLVVVCCRRSIALNHVLFSPFFSGQSRYLTLNPTCPNESSWSTSGADGITAVVLLGSYWTSRWSERRHEQSSIVRSGTDVFSRVMAFMHHHYCSLSDPRTEPSIIQLEH